MIQFDVVNNAVSQAPKNVLYLGESNTLQFVFAVSAGEVQFAPGDTIAVQAEAGLLTNAGAVQLHANSDWDYSFQTVSGEDTFTLTAQRSVTINPGQACMLQLSGFQPSDAGNTFVFSTLYRLGGRPEDGTTLPILIYDSPGTRKDLNSAIRFTTYINDDQPAGQPQLPENILYLSSQTLEPPIANSIHLNLAYNGVNGDVLVNNWEGQTPQITVFFSYGQGEDALTDDIQSGDHNPPQPYDALTSAWNIAAELSGDAAAYWNLQKPKQNTGSPYPAWVITPNINNQNLFSKTIPSLDLIFTGVISRLPAGTALIYVQWDFIPGYFGSAVVLPLSKQTAEAQVLAFNSPQNNQTINPGDKVSLNWTVFGGKQVQVSWDNGLRTQSFKVSDGLAPALTYTGSTAIVPDSTENECHIALDGVADDRSVKVIVSNFPPPEIATFKGALTKLNDDSLVIQLDMLVNNLGNKGIFDINGQQYNAGSYNGFPFSIQLPSAGMQFPKNFTLIATDTETAPNLRSSSSIAVDLPDWIIPQIKVFTASLQQDAGGRISNLEFQFEVANYYTFSTFSLDGTPVKVDETGKGRFQLAVDPAHPLGNSHTLVFTNPFAPAASQTLLLQFAQTNSINFTAGEQPIAIAIREQSQELYYLLHTFEYMIKKCTLNNSGNWDQGVSLHPRVWVFNPHDFRIAPDGSQAILYGGQDDSSHIFCVQYDETQFSGFVQPGDDEGVPEVIPPAAYGTDMRNVFFCGSDQKLYYISPIQLTFDNGFDFYSINGVAVTDIVVSADGNELYGIDPSSQFYIIDIKNNPAIASRHVIDLGNTKKLVSGQKGQVYFLSDKGIYGFYPRKDQSPVSLKEISFNVDNNTPFRFEVASNDTFLVCTDSNTLYVLLATASDPLQLYPNKPILLNNHPLDIAISPDNTRIFVLTGGSLEVFEAQFTMVGI